jgi:hypothetical protein
MRRWLLLLVVALCAVACSDGEPDGPSASLTTPPSTEAPTVEDEVEAAYLRSWEVYAEAMLELDGSSLGKVFSGAALQAARTELADLREANERALYEIEHDYTIDVKGEEAFVVDNYINHSVTLNGSTREPIEPDPNNRRKQVFVLQRDGSAWKVIEIRSA